MVRDRVIDGPSFHATTALRIVLLFAFCSPAVAQADDGDTRQRLCPREVSVDLSNANETDAGFLAESGEFFPTRATRVVDGVRRGCICDLKPCLPLCPPAKTDTGKPYVVDDFANYAAIPRVYTTDRTLDDVADDRPENWFHVFAWNPCPGRYDAYFLEPKKYPKDEYYLLRNGSLFSPLANTINARFLNFDVYCLRLRPDVSSYYVPRVCFLDKSDVVSDDVDVVYKLPYIGGLVSVPFIIATVIVYTILPELRNIHGSTLRCFLCCLTVMNVALAVGRLSKPDFDAGPWCLFLGFLVYFSFVAFTLWLNVICIDMWWRFGGFGSPKSSGVQHDREKFFWYSIYAWGVSLVMTAICIGMEFSPAIPDSFIRPGFRMQACWFETYTAAALYFFGPIGLVNLCNICLFVSTSIKLCQHKNNSGNTFGIENSGRHNQNRKWFSLHLKLFIVMGICWSTDTLSWLLRGPKYLWVFTDMVNTLHGLPIFLIFVCKRNIWRSLKDRYGNNKETALEK